MHIQLAIIALLVALLPATIVWASRDTRKYKKLVSVTLFFTFDLIMFGAFTRLTDSGLGCPDWPGCYGQANPFQAHADIHTAQTLMPTGPVTVAKAWIEMIHRYFAMAVGVLIIALMVLAWMQWIKSRRTESAFSPGLPTGLFLLVCLQGAFGKWTVTLKLQPIIVTIHLLLALALLAGLMWLYARQVNNSSVLRRPQRLWPPAVLALMILVVQIALGGWVSSNYAVLACTDFPLCHNELIPPMDFSHGFTLWRELGKTAADDYLPFQALTAIHWLHRSFAFVVVGLIGWVAYRARRMADTTKIANWIFVALAAQFATGVSTIFLNWPLLIAVMHNGGAAILVLLLVMLNYKARFSSDYASMPHGYNNRLYAVRK